MKSYVFRYKKLVDTLPNNYRKMHGQPMKRWVQLRKVCDARATRAEKAYRCVNQRICSLTNSFARVRDTSIEAMCSICDSFKEINYEET